MKHLICSEWEKIPRASLGPRVCANLQRLDDQHARKTKQTVFDWSLADSVRCQNWVGVICTTGLTLEIVPKVTDADDEPTRRAIAQENLLYMLAYTRNLPVRDRDMAPLLAQRLPMLEAVAALFAESLVRELRLGRDHEYVLVEENRASVRGKLLLTSHIKHNVASRQRMYVEYDELLVDTMLNRCLKVACRVLLRFTRRNSTRRGLGESLLFFDEVRDIDGRADDLASVRLDRSNAHFHVLFELAKVILENSTPGPARGGTSSFSLLFPMESVFEEFIATFLRRNAAYFGLAAHEVRAQSSGLGRHLLRDERNTPRYRLLPDVAIRRDEVVTLILDTKWKNLGPRGDLAAQSDVYQLYAYSQRFRCFDNVLLFPRTSNSSPRSYTIEGSPDARVRIEYVDVARPLWRDSDELLDELRRVVGRPDSVATKLELRAGRVALKSETL